MTPRALPLLPLDGVVNLGRTFLTTFDPVAVAAGTTVTVPPGATMVFALGCRTTGASVAVVAVTVKQMLLTLVLDKTSKDTAMLTSNSIVAI
jgi:hypothetical protein